MKRLLTMLLLSLFAIGMLTACNTISGAGQDVQSVGRAVENVAEDCKDNCLDNDR
ncbi:MAG: entericidin A/B family lipoprotein [Xanthomonadaceae bacterium]|nr:entericidin A/B family lipoprotein [Xanthomonadaceae bacterium]